MTTHPSKATPVVTRSLLAVCLLFTLSRYYQIIAAALAAGRGNFNYLEFVHRAGIGLIPKYAFESLIPWVTSIFYHADFGHLIGNAIVLWFLGRGIERELSRAHYLELFFVSATLGNLFHVLFVPTSAIPLMGASGGIMGLMVYYFLGLGEAELRRLGHGGIRAYGLMGVAMFLFVLPHVLSALVQAQQGVTHGVAYMGHLGGIVGGWLFFKFIERPNLPPPAPVARLQEPGPSVERRAVPRARRAA
jgi:membrane associated rhomboid family serine protease